MWRRASLDATFSGLSAHDVRVSLVNGLSIDRDTLLTAIEDAAGHDIARVEARVIAFAPVPATRDSTAIPAAGEIVGVDLNDGPRIDRCRMTAGRDLTAADTDVALLDPPSHGSTPCRTRERSGSGTSRCGTSASRSSPRTST